jgi:acyl carrier protein
VNNVSGFIALVRDELGLPVTSDNLDTDLQSVPGWDSVHLLSLLMILERETGRRISMPDMLEAQTLGRIYEVAAGT